MRGISPPLFIRIKSSYLHNLTYNLVSLSYNEYYILKHISLHQTIYPSPITSQKRNHLQKVPHFLYSKENSTFLCYSLLPNSLHQSASYTHHCSFSSSSPKPTTNKVNQTHYLPQEQKKTTTTHHAPKEKTPIAMQKCNLTNAPIITIPPYALSSPPHITFPLHP